MTNVAVTVASSVNVSSQVSAVPLHAPPQAENTEFASGTAVRVINCPSAKLALQAPPQKIPAGELDTVPDPLPSFKIVKRFPGSLMSSMNQP
jgi:hypothetical protein